MAELSATQKGGAKIIKSQIRAIETKLAKMERRLVEVDADMVPKVSKQIREAEEELARLNDKVAEKETPAENQLSLAESRIDAAMGWLERLEEIAETEYDPKLVRDAIQQMVREIKVDMVREPMGKRKHRSKLLGGVIHFRITGMPAGLTQFIFADSSSSEVQS